MGHAARQCPHSFHLFRPLQLVFNAFFFGYIPCDTPKTDGI